MVDTFYRLSTQYAPKPDARDSSAEKWRKRQAWRRQNLERESSYFNPVEHISLPIESPVTASAAPVLSQVTQEVRESIGTPQTTPVARITQPHLPTYAQYLLHQERVHSFYQKLLDARTSYASRAVPTSVDTISTNELREDVATIPVLVAPIASTISDDVARIEPPQYVATGVESAPSGVKSVVQRSKKVRQDSTRIPRHRTEGYINRKRWNAHDWQNVMDELGPTIVDRVYDAYRGLRSAFSNQRVKKTTAVIAALASLANAGYVYYSTTKSGQTAIVTAGQSVAAQFTQVESSTQVVQPQAPVVSQHEQLPNVAQDAPELAQSGVILNSNSPVQQLETLVQTEDVTSVAQDAKHVDTKQLPPAQSLESLLDPMLVLKKSTTILALDMALFYDKHIEPLRASRALLTEQPHEVFAWQYDIKPYEPRRITPQVIEKLGIAEGTHRIRQFVQSYGILILEGQRLNDPRFFPTTADRDDAKAGIDAFFLKKFPGDTPQELELRQKARAQTLAQLGLSEDEFTFMVAFQSHFARATGK